MRLLHRIQHMSDTAFSVNYRKTNRQTNGINLKSKDVTLFKFLKKKVIWFASILMVGPRVRIMNDTVFVKEIERHSTNNYKLQTIICYKLLNYFFKVLHWFLGTEYATWVGHSNMGHSPDARSDQLSLQFLLPVPNQSWSRYAKVDFLFR